LVVNKKSCNVELNSVHTILYGYDSFLPERGEKTLLSRLILCSGVTVVTLGGVLGIQFWWLDTHPQKDEGERGSDMGRGLTAIALVIIAVLSIFGMGRFVKGVLDNG